MHLWESDPSTFNLQLLTLAESLRSKTKDLIPRIFNTCTKKGVGVVAQLSEPSGLPASPSIVEFHLSLTLEQTNEPNR